MTMTTTATMIIIIIIIDWHVDCEYMCVKRS